MSTKSTKLKKGGVGVGDDCRIKCDRNENNESGMDNVDFDGDKVRDDEDKKKVQKMSKSIILSWFKKTVGLYFLTLGARLAFTKLR